MAQCPLIPGCISKGKGRAEALANIQEAIQLRFETRDEEGAAWPLPRDVEVLEVEVAA
ncbi:type II toxin-antitoxin system HicB family antitoxin [Nannocystis pusilla]|uniref:type II toxin-antitoxin system HicB family antitoxin n=1 Tax=Nannocystis pusilla TaxID=889268 RepID=UPI003B7E3834